MPCIEARGLRKAFGNTIAVDNIDLRVEEGRILGLIGPNGAGKTTALNAILGLTSFEGDLKVLGRDPWTDRERLMRDVSFISDVAVLPRWIKVSQALDYMTATTRSNGPPHNPGPAVKSEPSASPIPEPCSGSPPSRIRRISRRWFPR